MYLRSIDRPFFPAEVGHLQPLRFPYRCSRPKTKTWSIAGDVFIFKNIRVIFLRSLLYNFSSLIQMNSALAVIFNNSPSLNETRICNSFNWFLSWLLCNWRTFKKQIKYLRYNGLRSNIHKVFQGCEILNLIFLLAPWRILEKKNIKAWWSLGYQPSRVFCYMSLFAFWSLPTFSSIPDHFEVTDK